MPCSATKVAALYAILQDKYHTNFLPNQGQGASTDKLRCTSGLTYSSSTQIQQYEHDWLVSCEQKTVAVTSVLRLVDIPMTTPNHRRVSHAGVYSRQSRQLSTPNSRCSDSARNATDTLLRPMKRLLICTQAQPTQLVTF